MTSHDEMVQAHITAFWSTVAPEYEAHPGNIPARDSAEYGAWVDAIRDVLPPAPADVLDIATGTGFVALIAAGLGHRVTGIDLSSAMLDEARAEADRRGLEVTFEINDAVEPDFAPASFDAIISRHFIWTLREPGRALGNWLRLLRPGGRVVAIDGFWFNRATDGDAADDAPGLFEQHYTKETRAALPAMQMTAVGPIVAMFEQAGFDRVMVSDLETVHVLADSPPGIQPWYVVTACRPD
ncbi:MAG: class I SAM-dependent methyltransferase [Dehalococcoidia bacterium]